MYIFLQNFFRYLIFYSDDETSGKSFRGLSLDQLGGDIAGLRKKRHVFDDSLARKGVGNWEKHTKGIGAKLLLQVYLIILFILLFICHK